MTAKPPAMDFWFTMGSTYTYLTVMRLERVSRSTGVAVRWRPYDLRPILQETKHVPFPDGAAKTKYMWHDIGRQAAAYGFPARLPAPYPIADAALANSVALLGVREGWGQPFIRAAYERWFHFGEENGSQPNLRHSLASCGQDYDRVVELAHRPGTRHDLDVATNEARRLGLFGSPMFVVGDEVFWGNDRLEDAMNWCLDGRLVVR